MSSASSGSGGSGSSITPSGSDTPVLTSSTTQVTSTVPVAIPAGSASAPSLPISSDTNTGIYSPGSDQIALTAGGTQALTASTSAVTATLPVRTADGSSSAPAHSFSSETSMGWYRSASTKTSLGIGGNQIIEIDGNSGIAIPNANSGVGTIYLGASSNSNAPRIECGNASHKIQISAPHSSGNVIFKSAGNEISFVGNDGLYTYYDIFVFANGKGLKIADGANCRMGVVTLVGGSATVSNNTVTANTRIFITQQSDGGTIGSVRVSARSAGTNFTITSSNVLDTSVVAWLLIEPVSL